MITVTIAQKDLNVYATNNSKEYRRSDPELLFTSEGLEGNDRISGTLTRESGESIGTYEINQGVFEVRRGSGRRSEDVASSYNIIFNPGIFTITKRKITVSRITANDKVYDGNTDVTLNTRNMQIDGVIRGERDGLISVEGSFADKNAGENKTVNISLSLTGSNADHYELTNPELTTTADIDKLQARLTWDQTSFVYNGEKQIPAAEVSNKITGDVVEVTVESNRPSSINAGEYRATATALTGADADNYALPGNRNARSVPYSITKADSKIITPPTAKDLTYDGSAQELVTEGVAQGGTIQYSLNRRYGYSESIPTGRDAGTYTVYYRVVGDENHNGIDPQSLTVIIAKADYTVTAPEAYNLTYNGTNQRLISSAQSEQDATILYSLDGTNYIRRTSNITAKDAGEYTVYYKINETRNYNQFGPETVTATIAQAPVTVKANDVTISYGQAHPQLTPTITGLVNGEPESLISWELRLDANIDDKLNVGTYDIIASGEESQGNYKVTFVDGKFTVIAARLVSENVTINPEVSLEFEGNEINPIVVTYDDETLIPGTDYDVTFDPNPSFVENETEQKAIKATVTGKGNYSGTVNKEYTISVKKYSIEYDPNGGEGSIDPTEKYYTASATLDNNSDNKISRTGYQFVGWGLTADADKDHLVTTIEAMKDAPEKVYAVWEANKYTVRFDPNSDSYEGNMDDQEFTYDVKQKLTINAFSSTKKGYDCVFGGWAKGDETFASFADGKEVVNLTEKNNDTVTLYAFWYIDGSKLGGTIDGGTVVVYNDGSLNGEWVLNTYSDKTLIIVTPTASTVISAGNPAIVAGQVNYLNTTAVTPLHTVFGYEPDVTTINLVVNKLDPADPDIARRASGQGYTIVASFEATVIKTVNGVESVVSNPSSPVTIEVDMPSLPAVANGNQRSVVVFHNNGSVETLTPEISNGRARITVNSLSPFAIAYRDTRIPSGRAHNLPNTGVTNRTTGYVLLISVLGVLVALGDKLRKK